MLVANEYRKLYLTLQAYNAVSKKKLSKVKGLNSSHFVSYLYNYNDLFVCM